MCPSADLQRGTASFSSTFCEHQMKRQVAPDWWCIRRPSFAATPERLSNHVTPAEHPPSADRPLARPRGRGHRRRGIYGTCRGAPACARRGVCRCPRGRARGMGRQLAQRRPGADRHEARSGDARGPFRRIARARKLFAVSLESIVTLERIIADEAMPCEYERTGHLGRREQAVSLRGISGRAVAARARLQPHVSTLCQPPISSPSWVRTRTTA